MNLHKLFHCKSIILYTLISFTLCSCGGGSGANSSDSHGNIAGNLNNISLKNSNPVAIKYKEDVFNRAILDQTTANNPLSLAGTIGINLAQASSNSVFSFSESSTQPLYASLDSALRDKRALLSDISSALKISDKDLDGKGKLEIFNEKMRNAQYSNAMLVDDLYLTYLKNNVFPSSDINQLNSISQGANNYCKSIGSSVSPLSMTITPTLTIPKAFNLIIYDDLSAQSQLKDLRYKVLPSKLSADITDNEDLMLDINQYNAKVIDYEVNLIFSLKELYYIQIMQAALWNQRNDGCRNKLQTPPDFSNITQDKMPNLDGSPTALDNAIDAITKQYSYNLEKILVAGSWRNLLITETDMVNYLNKNIISEGAYTNPLLDVKTFIPSVEAPLTVGKCTISSLKFDANNNLLSKSFKVTNPTNQDGIMTLQGTCISQSTFFDESKKITLKDYVIALPFSLDSSSKLKGWRNTIEFDYNEGRFNIRPGAIAVAAYFTVDTTNPLVSLVGNETDISKQLPLLRFSDTIYEHYAWQDNDHMWYPGEIQTIRPVATGQPMVEFVNVVAGEGTNASDNYKLFPHSTPCINGCPFNRFEPQLIKYNGTRKELQPTIKDLGQKVGYKVLNLASFGKHLFATRLIYTLTNEQTSGVHSSASGNDAPINQYIELMCLTDDCKATPPNLALQTQDLEFTDGTKVSLSLTGKNDYFGDNQYAADKLYSYNKDKYGPPRKFFWSITSSNSPIKPNLELPVVNDKLPADYSKWIENYNGNNDYLGAVLVIGGVLLSIGLVITIGVLLSQHEPDPQNPEKIKPIEIAYSPNLKYRVIFDLNDFTLRIENKDAKGIYSSSCDITSVPGATRIAFADGQINIYQGSTLAWNNQLEYSKMSLQWVHDTFAKLTIDDNGVLVIRHSDGNKNLGFEPRKASNKDGNVAWEVYPDGARMCASSSALVKEQIDKNNGNVSSDEYSDFKPNDYTLSNTADFSYPRDSLEDIPVGRYGLKTVLITNVSKGVLLLNKIVSNLKDTYAGLVISNDKRYTTCELNGATSLIAGQSCKIAYKFTPDTEGLNYSFNASAEVLTSNGTEVKGNTMYFPVYSRVPTDKPKGDYLSKCTNITWLEGNLSAVCGFKKPRSSLLYFKQCKRNPIPTDVTVKDGMLVCVSPL